MGQARCGAPHSEEDMARKTNVLYLGFQGFCQIINLSDTGKPIIFHCHNKLQICQIKNHEKLINMQIFP